MKKTFKLQASNKHPDRVVEGIKHEIRKYIKREKRKNLPEEFDFWNFDCKFSKDEEHPSTIEFVEITKLIDEAVEAKAETIYMELIAKPAKREKKEIIIIDDENEDAEAL